MQKTSFFFRSAGNILDVAAIYPTTRDYCTPFLCDGTPDFSVTITPEDIAFERIKAARENEL